MSQPLLVVKGLVRDFGSFRAVDHVDFEVLPGTIHAVIGPNGAGKSTLFKLITGSLKPTSGHVTLSGESIEGKRAHAVARRGLVQVFQLSSVYSRLTVAESVAASIVSRRRRTLDVVTNFHRTALREATAILDQVGLAERASTIAGTLSHGEQRALEIAMALAIEPTVLMLDEPTAGMSPAETRATADLIVSEVRGRGITVVLSEHDMDVVFGVSDHVTVLHQGQVIADGTPEAVRSHDEVMAIYLGHGAAKDGGAS